MQTNGKFYFPLDKEGVKSALELWLAGLIEAGLNELVAEEFITVQKVKINFLKKSIKNKRSFIGR